MSNENLMCHTLEEKKKKKNSSTIQINSLSPTKYFPLLCMLSLSLYHSVYPYFCKYLPVTQFDVTIDCFTCVLFVVGIIVKLETTSLDFEINITQKNSILQPFCYSALAYYYWLGILQNNNHNNKTSSYSPFETRHETHRQLLVWYGISCWKVSLFDRQITNSFTK